MRIITPAIFALLFFLGAASRNITPDAVTRATTWNSHKGDPDVLGDGKVPQDADALPFTWKTKGILVFAWEEPLQLEKLNDSRYRSSRFYYSASICGLIRESWSCPK